MRIIRHTLPPWRRVKNPPVNHVEAVPPPYPSWLTRPPHYSQFNVQWLTTPPAPPGNIYPPGEFQYASLYKNPIYQSNTSTHFVGLDFRLPWIVDPDPVPEPFSAYVRRDPYLSRSSYKKVSVTPIPWAQPTIVFPLAALVRPATYFSRSRSESVQPTSIPWAIPFIEPSFTAAQQAKYYRSRSRYDLIQAIPVPFLASPTVPPVVDLVELSKIYRSRTNVKHISNPVIPWLSGDWILFTFPDEGNFNANSILGSRWKIYFLQAGTDSPSPVSANSDGTLIHASPVMLDRYGNLPTIYINSLVNYDISVRNEYGVERHLIEDY